MTIWPKTWLIRVPLVLVVIFSTYTATLYFGMPALIRYLGQKQAAAALRRPVTIGDISFNPYTLRLTLAHLKVGERQAAQHFVEIESIKLKLSWASLPHLAL